MGIPILLGGALLMLPVSGRTGDWTGPVEAFFMATSATCVTGHTIVDPGSYFSVFGQLVLLALVQVGGLGFMTMAMALLIVAGRRLSLRNESALSISMGTTDAREIKRFMIRTVWMSLAIELAGALALAVSLAVARGYPPGRALYHGVFHSVCAFCNAGLSLNADNLAGFTNDPFFLSVVMALIILGGIGFLVLSELSTVWRRRGGGRVVLSLHSRIVVVVTLFLLLAGWIGFAIFEWRNTLAPLAPMDKLVCSLFHSVTARTAGFNVVDMAQVYPVTRFMTMGLMFIGGSPGSTAGGIKITTIVVLLFTAAAMVRSRRETVILGRTVSPGVMGTAVAVFILAVLAVTAAFGLLLVTEQDSIRSGTIGYEALLFDTVSAFSTVGLSTGVPPVLSTAGKIIMTVCMFVGRVGPLTLALFIGMKDQRHLIRYPEEDVIIG